MNDIKPQNLDPDFKDSPDGKILIWAQDMYEYERETQAKGRSLRARDERFYDGHQHTDEEKEVYALRNQTARTYNEIKPAVDWVLGSERRARSDWNVLPRTEDDVEPAQVKTKLIKYIDDINKAKWQRSKSFEDCVKTGEGWTRVSVEPNEDGELMVSLNHENWRNMLCDSQSVQEDLSDCRYLWLTKIVDVETLAAHFPEKKTQIQADAGEFEDLHDDLIQDQVGDSENTDLDRSRVWQYSGCANNSTAVNIVRSGTMSITGGYYSSTRQAVRVWEMWYKKTERVELLANAGGLTGQIFDSNDQVHLLAVEEGAAKRFTVREQMHCVIYTNTTVLFSGQSFYKHNRYPFVRRLAFIDKTTKSPYGLIRQIIDPQSDLNQRRNQALWLMATRQVVADEDAVDDVDEAIKQVAKVNGYIKTKRGAKFEILDNVTLAAPHVQMGEMDSGYIKQISGVTSENRGMNQNSMSGVAIQSLQEQGTIITTPVIDNHQLAHQLEGELILSLCEQYISRKMQFRVTSDIKNPSDKDFTTLNDGKPETDITAHQADFVVSQRDYRQSMRQALSEQLLAVSAQISQATGDPMLSIAFVEMAIELQDLPNKQQLLGNLRKAANLPPIDENADDKEKREAMQQQEAEKQQAMQELIQQLEIDKVRAAINLDNSRTNQYNREGEREKANARRAQAEAMVKYMEAAGMVVQNGELSDVADDLIRNMDNIMNGTGMQPVEGQPAPQSQPIEQAPVDMQTSQPMQPEQPPMQQEPPIPEQPVMPEGAGEPDLSPEEAAMMEQIMAEQSQQPNLQE